MQAGRATVLLSLLAAGLGVAAIAYAGFEEDYENGLKELDHGRPAEAQRFLQRALAQQSDPVESVNIEGNSQPYLPLHFLGVAAVRLGDCAGAEKFWSSPGNRRMIARLNVLRQQEQQALASCRPVNNTAQKDEAAKAAAEAAAAAKQKAEEAAAAAAASAKPPEALVQALQNYLGGRYLAATRIDPATLADARAKFHAYVVRSAARFMLASTGLGDQGLIDAARGDARAAKALDARTQPDAATFPPRFRAFYEAAR